MRREMPANPFETSEAVKAANLAEARARRGELDAVRGAHGSDGPVADAISRVGSRLLEDDGPIDRRVKPVFEDPDAFLGGVAVGLVGSRRPRNQ